ncbi:MAG: AAA family ATPase [Alphaproteobacteria bacterium]|nr:AAA family ATPase [Alphaproteobacteria bacterium]
MRDATLLDAALDAARAQPVPGRLHYADLAAFLAERDPARFAPTPTRKTPHYTLWRTLDGADDFETLGDGWFWYRPWGPATDHTLRLSADGGRALRTQSRAVRGRASVAGRSEQSDGMAWVPFFRALAEALRPYRTRSARLVEILEEIRAQDLPVTALQDKDVEGNRTLLTELDPFTFLGAFCRGITDDARLEMARLATELLDLDVALPHDFAGLPLLNNQASWFFAYQAKRRPGDLERLWDVFELALEPDPLANPAFGPAFDEALTVSQVNVNLTMALFWIRPDVFLTLDKTMRSYTGIKLPSRGIDHAFYAHTIAQARARFGLPFPTLSLRAWSAAGRPQEHSLGGGGARQTNAWLVGAYWEASTPVDQTDRFLREGIWENGHADKHLDDVKHMAVGDLIAIKTWTTQKHGLPFDGRGKTVPKNTIKATGTIVANRGDGRTVEVEWDETAEQRDWFFYTSPATVWRLKHDHPMAQRLRRFVFEGEPQDLDWFTEQWWGQESPDGDPSPLAGEPDGSEEVAPALYGLEDVVDEGVFLDLAVLERALARLRQKKNLILQGAPGTGKSFLAPKLAYALMDERAPERIERLLFHPSTTYEDMVRGLRPGTTAGSFELKDGPLWRVAERAADDPERDHVLLIDEINRGNLAQIFGECLQLLEADKRGPEHAITPLYTRHDGERFFLPPNLYVIGTMNVADRSLALVDFALRRRFAFLTLPPQYQSPAFRRWMTDRGMPASLLHRIVQAMTRLNETITNDASLGPAFQVGHSFFCPRGEDFSSLDDAWFLDVVDTEIDPLLHEYWYDDAASADAALAALRGAT